MIFAKVQVPGAPLLDRVTANAQLLGELGLPILTR